MSCECRGGSSGVLKYFCLLHVDGSRQGNSSAARDSASCEAMMGYLHARTLETSRCSNFEQLPGTTADPHEAPSTTRMAPYRREKFQTRSRPGEDDASLINLSREGEIVSRR